MWAGREAVVSPMKIAVVQYRPDFLTGWSAFADKIDALAGASVKAGAGLVVVPEYAGLELVSLLPAAEAADLSQIMPALREMLPEYLAIHGQVARRHGCSVVAGSLPVLIDGVTRNRAHVFGPHGLVGMQDKLVPTRFERDVLGISGGGAVTVIEAPFGRFGVALGDDIAFPALIAAMAEAGARLVVAPSRADTTAGANRLRLCARARAVEYQFYVAQAPLVGACDWSPAMPASVGAAAIFTPCDGRFPTDGILAQGISDAPQVVIGELDFDRIDDIRTDGPDLAFRNHRELVARMPLPVEIVPLTPSGP
jgi:predicted amidohydrolase